MSARRRLAEAGRAGLLAMGGAGGAGDGPSSAPRGAAPPATLRVDVSGCAALRAGPACELAANRRVRLVVHGDAAATIMVHAGGAPVETGKPTLEGDAARFDVRVPDGARTLEISRASGERATVQLAPDGRPDWLRQAREARGRGAFDEALALADPHLGGSVEARAFAYGIAGRVALSKGDFLRAAAAFDASRAAHLEAGRISDAVGDAFAETFVLAEHVHDFARARAVLAFVAPLQTSYPDGWAMLPYYEAIVARSTGDMRGHLEGARTAETRTRLLGLEAERREAIAERARGWEQSGRFREACVLWRELDAPTDAAGACAGARRRANLAVTALDAEETTGEIPAECPSDPAAVLEEALRGYARSCPNAADTASARIALARARVRAGEPARADAALAELDLRALSLSHRVAAAVVAGRAAAARGAFDVAIATFTRAERDADVAGLRIHALRAAVGHATALAARGDPQGALDALTRSSARFDERSLAIPIADGRAMFASTARLATRIRVDLLLALGRDRDAFDDVVRAHGRAAWGAEVGDALSQLSAGRQERWDEALGAYHRARAKLEVSLKAAEELPTRARDAELRTLADASAGMKRQLAAALETVSVTAPSRAPWPCADDAPGTTWLALARTEHGVAALFGEASGAVRRAHLGPLSSDPTQRAAALLAPADDILARTTILRVIADPSLDDVPIHALPFRGAPVGARIAVEYSVLGACRKASVPDLRGDAGMLLVANARGDLEGTADEARRVGVVLERAGVPFERLEGDRATGRAVRTELARVAFLHYAGHARRGDEPWTSALLLAGTDRLDVADVLALPRAPRIAALSACEGGHETHEAMGLAQALVRRGADAVIAATRPVRDRTSGLYWERFYGALATDAPTASLAARSATMEVARRTPDELDEALAFRVLVP